MNENLLSTNLGRRWRLPVLTLSLALALILLVVVASHAARGCHSMGSGLQLYNLESQPAPFTAYFYKPNGDLQHSFDGAIQPGCNAFFEFAPEDVLTGSLRLQTDQEVVGVNLHLATQEFDGNDAFEMVPGDITTTVYFAPWLMRDFYGMTSRLLVGNLAPDFNTATVEFFDLNGMPITSTVLSIPENGTAFLRLEEVAGLEVGFIGSAIVSAYQPIWADVVQQGATQIASYAVPMEGSPELFLPYAPGYEAGITQPSIVVHNLGAMDASVLICSSGGSCEGYVLWPGASLIHGLTSPDPDAYIVTSDQPVAAVATVGGAGGSWAYAGLPPDKATRYHYAPMIFSNYQGIDTTLWLFNPGMTTTVEITFTGTPTPTIWATSQPIYPYQMIAVAPPSGQAHYAAQVDAGPDGQILAVVEGLLPAADGRFAYRTSGYLDLEAPVCQPHVVDVPTLSEWGYIILTIAVVLIAAWAIRRQLRPARGPTSA